MLERIFLDGIIITLYNKAMLKFIEKRSESIVNDIIGDIYGNKILDIGSGNCNVAKKLSSLGLDITALDVKNRSLIKPIKPVLYNGKQIPFKDNFFDTTLLIFVMHHTKDPVGLLKEAKRVSRKRIVIKEDIYRNEREKLMTYISDSFVNFEFLSHPHTNKSDPDWKNVFTSLNLNLISYRYSIAKLLCFPFYHGTYILDKN